MTKQLKREMFLIGQRAKKRADRFIRFANGVKCICNALGTIPDKHILTELIKKEETL